MSRDGRGRRRVVVKIGSSSLTEADGSLALSRMRQMVSEVARLGRETGCQFVLVSSGAIAAGLGRLGWQRAHISMPEKQAAAAVGQVLLMEHYERLFAEHGIAVGQILMTRADVEDRKRFVNIRNTVMALLQRGVMPIINENDTVAVEEIRFGDNDTLAALVALVAEADTLVLLTDIDGLYTANPRQDPTATRIAEVEVITDEIERIAGGAGSSAGTGGMRTKIAAAKIATQSGVEVVIAHRDEPRVLERVLAGELVGTRFLASREPVSLRKSWLLHAPKPEGALQVDHGAMRALIAGGKSLLLPGLVQVHGEFQEGAVVELVGPTGAAFGKGISNFSSRDLAEWLAKKRAGEDVHALHEVVHRNDMVIWTEATAG
ncbi:MAG: glutamate 5-kinase [Alicyclobacillus mali]|uniref:glutamate 5-kinase n=1 Tax=Alicyclobacillus mali (ex Roth et al. 2021) TaxID=1123961 RepID=UPI00082B9494|nr:glutamate 5-kinase [Alicyclobacillus mali (ex Roth et al. 2021)]MCL6489188.1 glutamate 5-kinase [Alicyclobacillus mali (ex Roth et al. 2021)]